MANLSDVEDALVNLIQPMFYPNGPSNPSIVPSVNDIAVFAGWPESAKLETEINANNAIVSIFPQNSGRNTTRFPQNWVTQSITAATLSAIVSGDTVTIGGTVSVPQAVMIIVNRIGYSYQVQPGDTLDTIATNAAALLPSATAIGAVITVNAAFSLIASITQSGVAAKEIKRQEVVFNIITWAKTRPGRTDVSEVVEVGLGALDRFLLPTDNFYAPICYSGIRDHDEFQKTYACYRRDLMFRIEYPTIITETSATITDVVNNISTGPVYS